MLLRVDNMNASISAIHILHDVSLEVDAGEAVCLIGANGAGKSTLMRSISGLLRPVKGSIRFDGHDIAASSASQIVRRGVSLVPEGRRVFSPLTVQENLKMGAFTRSDHRETLRDLEWILSLFPKLKERLTQRASTLSGGEQQMLAIGRALMSRPRLLLLDEPSLGLAPKVVSEIFAKIAELGSEGTAILVAEQNASMALGISTRGYLLSNGRSVLSAKKTELVNNEEIRKTYLGV